MNSTTGEFEVLASRVWVDHRTVLGFLLSQARFTSGAIPHNIIELGP